MPTSADRDHADDRAAMVQRLRRTGIGDARVLAAMGTVPRELFVPEGFAEVAYADEPVPIRAGQTVSTPWIVAAMAEALGVAADARVLEVGTGSGYGAAVLSHLCRWVVTVERHRELVTSARAVLSNLGYEHVEVLHGDGSDGVPHRAPFDGIVVTAMAEGRPPPALVDQLAPHGTLVCPVGRGHHGDLQRLRDGSWDTLAPVGFVPLVEGGPGEPP